MVVYPTGVKSWSLRYRNDKGEPRRAVHWGTVRRPRAGRSPPVAADLKLRVVKGADPSADKREARRTGKTVRDVFERYDEKYLAKKVRPATAAKARAFFKSHVFPAIGDRGIADVKRRDVLDIVDTLADFPAAQNRGQAVMSAFFGWAVEEEVIDVSPSNNIKPRGEVISRDRVLSDDELRRVLIAADTAGYPFGPMVRLLTYTMARRSEVAAMPYAELNRSERLWKLPRERSKNKQAHDVYLTDAALVVLDAVPQVDDCEFVFTTNGTRPVSGFAKMKSRLDKIIGAGMDPWTLHDLRRTGSTKMQKLGIRPEVIEACQNHLPQGIKAVYQRHAYAAEMAYAFEVLAREVDRIVEGRAADSNVVPMTRPAA